MKMNNRNINTIINAITESIGQKRDYYAVHEPIIPSSIMSHVSNAIKSNYISSLGEYMDKFRDQLQKITKANYVILTNSGTSALQMIFNRLSIQNCEVLVPSMSFVATSNAVIYNNGIPHFIDSLSDHPCIDTDKLEKYLNDNFIIKNDNCYNPKTKRKVRAIIGVHAFGNCVEIDKLKKICKNFKLELIEDAAGAIGSFYKSLHVGSLANYGILSFNGNKLITTGMGGALLLKKKSDYLAIKHQISTARIKHPYEIAHDEVGYNFRMTNINAAIGYSQLLALNKTLIKKKLLFNRYNDEFKKFEYCKIIKPGKNEKPNYWINNLLFDDLSENMRKKLFNHLHKEKLLCRALWTPLHSLKMNNKYPKMNLSNSLHLWKNTISLPSSYL